MKFFWVCVFCILYPYNLFNYITKQFTNDSILLSAAKFGAWALLKERCDSWSKTIMDDGRFDLLAPKPVRGLSKLILKGDKKVSSTYLHLFYMLYVIHVRTYLL